MHKVDQEYPSWIIYSVLIFSGASGVFAFAPFHASFLIIPVVCAVLFAVNAINPKSSIIKLLAFGYALGLAYFNTQLYWIFYSVYYVIQAHLIVAIIAQIGFTIFLASYIALAVCLYVKLKTKYQLFNLMFLFPSVWVLLEWFRGWFLSGFSWCDFGYTVVSVHLFKGLFPLLGEYGVSFILLSLIGAIYLVLFYSNVRVSCKFPFIKCDPKKTQNMFLAMSYVVMLIITANLLVPIKYTKPIGKATTVALLQGNVPSTLKWQDFSELRVYKNLIEHAHAAIIMIPETAITQFEMNLPHDYLNNLANFANSKHETLLIGMPKIIDSKYDYINAAVVLTAKNRPYYAKYHLVPYGEYIPAKSILGPLYNEVSLPMVNFSAGKRHQKPLIADNQKIAMNICYENGFASELIWAARQSTIMANLSDMVWYGRTIAMYQHLQLSQARALENQRYFLQVTNTGLTAVINQEGEVIAKLPIFTRGTLKEKVQGMTGTTPFERYGNYLIIILCIMLIVCAVLFRTINTNNRNR